MSGYTGTYWRDEHGHLYWIQGWSKDERGETVRLLNVTPRDKEITVGELTQGFTQVNKNGDKPSALGHLKNEAGNKAWRGEK